MRLIGIIDAPSVLGLFPQGVERMPEALHAQGLAAQLGAVEHEILRPPLHVSGRDPVTGLNNAKAIVEFSETLAGTVEAMLNRGRMPLVVGGDCSIVFGPLLALARRGECGLLFLDGHADFSHPDDDPSGEAASMDLALATGRGPEGFGPIGGHHPLITDDRVAVLGYRVHTDGTDTCRGVHIDDTPIVAIDLAELRRRGLEQSIDDALAVVTRDELDGFWIHIDVDVLHDDLMPAVDYRYPDGLSWEELATILSAALATGRAKGIDITIFNPNLDQDGHLARRLVQLLRDALT